MSVLSECHKKLTNGVGRCSVPMWMMGCPAGFCDEPAYGEQEKGQTRYGEWSSAWRKWFPGYCSGLACYNHGGPRKEAALNLCDYCQNEIPTCEGSPSFGTGKGNDNVYECDGFIDG